MQEHRRRRATQRSPATPISPKGGSGTPSISLLLLLQNVTGIQHVTGTASSSLGEFVAVALATNATVFMKRGTKREESIDHDTILMSRRSCSLTTVR